MAILIHYPESGYYLSISFSLSHPFDLFVQIADPVVMGVDEEGCVQSECLHWEGLPSILWDVLSAAGYPSPPRYMGREFMEMGVTWCQVHMTLLPPPAHPECPALEIEAMSCHLVDTWETAAMRALTTFCE
jgi:hypothetical protein